jgi:hypothetical protein
VSRASPRVGALWARSHVSSESDHQMGRENKFREKREGKARPKLGGWALPTTALETLGGPSVVGPSACRSACNLTLSASCVEGGRGQPLWVWGVHSWLTSPCPWRLPREIPRRERAGQTSTRHSHTGTESPAPLPCPPRRPSFAIAWPA